MIAINDTEIFDGKAAITNEDIKNLPKMVDWRKEGILTNAKQQLSCGCKISNKFAGAD